MTTDERQPKLIHSVLGEDEENRLLELLDYLDNKIPVVYRRELLSYLLPGRSLTEWWKPLRELQHQLMQGLQTVPQAQMRPL